MLYIEQCSIQQCRELLNGSTATLIGSDRAMNLAPLLEAIRTIFLLSVSVRLKKKILNNSWRIWEPYAE